MKTPIIQAFFYFTFLCLVVGCAPSSASNADKGKDEPKPPTLENPEPTAEETTTSRGNGAPIVAPAANEGNAGAVATLCSNPEFNLQAHLTTFAKDIEAQNIMYDSEPLSKCSGMFLRTCRSVAEVCPESKFRDLGNEVSTREEAAWYYQNGDFVLIENAEARGDYIRPGVIMFYGQQGMNYTKGENLDIGTLTALGTGIEHMGVVLDVITEDGKVISYDLFHGRSTGKPAGITTHYLDPNSRSSSRNDLPAYGNWDQQWVGVASILTPNT